MAKYLIRNKISTPLQGSYGSYLPWKNGMGLKVLSIGAKTIEGLLRSKTFAKAFKEASFLTRASLSCSFIPKCFGLKIIKKNNRYYIAIIMKHISGMDAHDFIDQKISSGSSRSYFYHKRHYLKKAKKLNRQLSLKAHLVHKDLHCGNVMVGKKKIYLIDFSHDFILDKVKKKAKTMGQHRAKKMAKSCHQRMLKRFSKELSKKEIKALEANKHLKKFSKYL